MVYSVNALAFPPARDLCAKGPDLTQSRLARRPNAPRLGAWWHDGLCGVSLVPLVSGCRRAGRVCRGYWAGAGPGPDRAATGGTCCYDSTTTHYHTHALLLLERHLNLQPPTANLQPHHHHHHPHLPLRCVVRRRPMISRPPPPLPRPRPRPLSLPSRLSQSSSSAFSNRSPHLA